MGEWSLLEKILGSATLAALIGAGRMVWNSARNRERGQQRLDENHELLVEVKKDFNAFKSEVRQRFESQAEETRERFETQAKMTRQEFADMRIRFDKAKDAHSELAQRVAAVEARSG